MIFLNKCGCENDEVLFLRIFFWLFCVGVCGCVCVWVCWCFICVCCLMCINFVFVFWYSIMFVMLIISFRIFWFIGFGFSLMCWIFFGIDFVGVFFWVFVFVWIVLIRFSDFGWDGIDGSLFFFVFWVLGSWMLVIGMCF